MSSKPSNHAFAAIAAIACCNIALGLVTLILPLIMEQGGYSARFMGVSAAIWPVGVLIAAFYVPRIVRRFGGKSVAMASVLALIFCLALFPITSPTGAWLPLRFLFGLAVSGLFTVSEAWILSEVEDGKRGQVIGIYMTVLTLTFGVAPAIVPYTGITTYLPWLIGILCLAAGFAVITSARIAANKSEEPHSNMLHVVAKIPLVYLCIGAVTMFENIMLPFFSIFAMRRGLDLQNASFLLAFSIIACALLFYPTGRLADKWSRNGVAILCAAIAIICSVALFWLITSSLAWPLTLLARAGVFGVYAVVMTLMGDNLKGPDLIAGSAVMSMFWGLGGIVGPPISGAVIDATSINALPFLLAAPFSAVLIALALNKGQVVRE